MKVISHYLRFIHTDAVNDPPLLYRGEVVFVQVRSNLKNGIAPDAL